MNHQVKKTTAFPDTATMNSRKPFRLYLPNARREENCPDTSRLQAATGASGLVLHGKPALNVQISQDSDWYSRTSPAE